MEDTMVTEDPVGPTGSEAGEESTGEVIGSSALRPVFLGNLSSTFTSEQVAEVFERPMQPTSKTFLPIPVDRVDLKRGYCFVFLKDATSQAQKEQVEQFVSDINGMQVPGVSTSLRAEFARGDGRIKRKEDERRKQIMPSKTLFVVNFCEETTKREDLETIFTPYGKIFRIDMKRNYAFVEFETVEEAQRARDGTNMGKIDQSVLTVEFATGTQGGGDRGGRSYRDKGRRDRGRGRGGNDDRGGRRGDRDRDRYDRDRDRYRRDDRDRYDDRGRRSPPRYRRRSRSRSRSPPYRSSRSPPRRYDDCRDRYDDRHRGGGGRSLSPDRDRYRDRDRDRRNASPDRDYRGGGGGGSASGVGGGAGGGDRGYRK